MYKRQAESKELVLGTYSVNEITAPNGFVLNSTPKLSLIHILEQFIPLEELSYLRWVDATPHFRVGDRVLVKILELDRSDRNLSLIHI